MRWASSFEKAPLRLVAAVYVITNSFMVGAHAAAIIAANPTQAQERNFTTPITTLPKSKYGCHLSNAFFLRVHRGHKLFSASAMRVCAPCMSRCGLVVPAHTALYI